MQNASCVESAGVGIARPKKTISPGKASYFARTTQLTQDASQMKGTFFAAFLFSLLAGCGSPPAAPSAAPSAKAHDAITAEALISKLTSHGWATEAAKRPVGQEDYTTWDFQPNGRYRAQLHSDFTAAPDIGFWNVARDSDGQWWVAFDSGLRQRVTLKGDDVQLGTALLRPTGEARKPGGAPDLPNFQLQPAAQEMAKRLTAHAWKRANDLQLDVEPTRVRFHPDWEYQADYRGGECVSRGVWYVSPQENVASGFTGDCMGAKPPYRDEFRIDFLDEPGILIADDLYVPADKPLPRGVVWALPGYDNPRVRIEYDMPIHAGQRVRFDVTITNLEHSPGMRPQPLTVERFSLTEKYHSYRQPDQSLDIPAEVFHRDLADRKLMPGETLSLQFDMEAPAAPSMGFYFNVLMRGETQHWDLHAYLNFPIHTP
jgi:hypothetical protein